MSNKSGNIFQNIPQNLEHELFDLLAKKGDVKIERIISMGHTSPESDWYDQQQDEWVMVLKGSGSITFESGETLTLNSGDYLHIPAHQKHRVSKTDPQTETVWLAIHY